MGKLENEFQKEVINDLRRIFPGCMILKNDPKYIQGVPDLLLLYKDKWAMLETKKSANEPRQPNQEYYVDMLNRMSYSSFIYPENKQEVYHEIQRTFGSRWSARISFAE